MAKRPEYYSDKETDKLLGELESKIDTVYKDAWAEVDRKASAYFKEWQGRYEREYEKYLAGEYTEKQWEDWKIAQIGRGERWEKLRDNLAKRLTEADKVARAYINDGTPTIYSLNANFEAFVIDSRYTNNSDIAWDIYDEQTIKKRIMDNDINLPQPSINVKKDELWNRKKLNEVLTSGILQGKDPNKIAKDFIQVAQMDRSAAIRAARTSYTGAQNAGRLDTYERATEMGIDMLKEWICTKDNDTRQTHADLDGQRVPYNEPFIVTDDDTGEVEEIMYPAEPTASAKMIYNCRCTMRAVIKGANDQKRETWNDLAEQYTNFSEWKKKNGG